MQGHNTIDVMIIVACSDWTTELWTTELCTTRSQTKFFVGKHVLKESSANCTDFGLLSVCQGLLHNRNDMALNFKVGNLPDGNMHAWG